MHKFMRTHMQKGKHLCPIFVLSWSDLTLSRSVALNFFVGSTFSPHINGIEKRKCFQIYNVISIRIFETYVVRMLHL